MHGPSISLPGELGRAGDRSGLAGVRGGVEYLPPLLVSWEGPRIGVGWLE